MEEALDTPDGGSILSIDIDLNFARREFANDVEKTARRQCSSSGVIYARLATAAYTDIKVGCGKMDFVFIGLQQDVGKNWKRCAGADDVLDLLQTFEQFVFGDVKFHDNGSV